MLKTSRDDQAQVVGAVVVAVVLYSKKKRDISAFVNVEMRVVNVSWV